MKDYKMTDTNENKPLEAYIFDIDGTLTQVGDRVNCLKESPPNWDSFYDRCGEDAPIEPAINLLSILLTSMVPVRLITGRRESCRYTTLDWFENNGVYINSKQLYMRPDGDFRPDTIVKPELLVQAAVEPIIIFEDRNSMVKHWRENGFTCYHVAEGNF